MPTLIIQHSPRSTGGVLTHVLRDHGLRMKTVRLDQGQALPTDLDDIDGIISLGGSPSATDNSIPWLEPELALLKSAHDKEHSNEHAQKNKREKVVASKKAKTTSKKATKTKKVSKK